MSAQYKNPALRSVNGVLHSYCVRCGALIGTEYDTDWHSIISRQRCRPCADARRMECDAARHRRARRGIRAERREYQTQLDQLREIAAAQEELLHRYRSELEYIRKSPSVRTGGQAEKS